MPMARPGILLGLVDWFVVKMSRQGEAQKNLKIPVATEDALRDNCPGHMCHISARTIPSTPAMGWVYAALHHSHASSPRVELSKRQMKSIPEPRIA